MKYTLTLFVSNVFGSLRPPWACPPVCHLSLCLLCRFKPLGNYPLHLVIFTLKRVQETHFWYLRTVVNLINIHRSLNDPFLDPLIHWYMFRWSFYPQIYSVIFYPMAFLSITIVDSNISGFVSIVVLVKYQIIRIHGYTYKPWEIIFFPTEYRDFRNRFWN